MRDGTTNLESGGQSMGRAFGSPGGWEVILAVSGHVYVAFLILDLATGNFDTRVLHTISE